MRLLCSGSEVLTEKKEERSSNTSTGRSCSPLCPAGGHICWFSGPQIINLSADDGYETWEWRLTHTHTHKQIHTQACTCADTHWVTFAHKQEEHTHTHAVLHNKWWHFNCCACLFTPGRNGWSFFAWQPIRARQEECAQPCRSGHIPYNLTFLFIHNTQT